ncbi:MAG: hypothetical protein KJZ93_09935 [Caldilineaceae bacterium]|nr:hypothetical protein [Caldilineaceae bacterium]
MSFLRKWFGGAKLDGAALAQSSQKAEYAQIELLAGFVEARAAHEGGEQQRWNRVLPRPYAEMIELFQKEGWLAATPGGLQVTPAAQPFVERYQQRLAAEKAAVLPQVRKALAARDTGEALEIRRAYEARQPLGKAAWTGEEPQLSHSALTRRILFLNHWLLEGLSAETVTWLKGYAAEQHLWGTSWRLPLDEIPLAAQQELMKPGLDAVEAAYWQAHQLILFVENQETWQRCKGGDHVRRLEIVGPDDEHTCAHCRPILGKQFLVARAPELPPRDCTSLLGCRCRYEPVLESYEER